MLTPATDAVSPLPTPALIDVELSALVYLLTRCAKDGSVAHHSLALQHLEQMAGNGMAPPLLRHTADRLARQWQDDLRTLKTEQAVCAAVN